MRQTQKIANFLSDDFETIGFKGHLDEYFAVDKKTKKLMVLDVKAKSPSFKQYSEFAIPISEENKFDTIHYFSNLQLAAREA